MNSLEEFGKQVTEKYIDMLNAHQKLPVMHQSIIEMTMPDLVVTLIQKGYETGMESGENAMKANHCIT